MYSIRCSRSLLSRTLAPSPSMPRDAAPRGRPPRASFNVRFRGSTNIAVAISPYLDLCVSLLPPQSPDVPCGQKAAHAT